MAISAIKAIKETGISCLIESLKYFCEHKHFKQKEIRVKTDLIIRDSTKRALEF